VRTAQTYLDWTVIKAPIDGVILEKLVDVNELVSPQSFGGERSPSTALVAIADPNDLQVEIELNERDVAKVALGLRCRVSPEAYPDRAYDGYVAEMAPEASRQKGTLQVKVQIEKPDEYLTPNLNAKVDFLTQNKPTPGASTMQEADSGTGTKGSQEQ
jgi:HlyD family secretion protein